jgi:hypothetical protein
VASVASPLLPSFTVAVLLLYIQRRCSVSVHVQRRYCLSLFISSVSRTYPASVG